MTIEKIIIDSLINRISILEKQVKELKSYSQTHIFLYLIVFVIFFKLFL